MLKENSHILIYAFILSIFATFAPLFALAQTNRLCTEYFDLGCAFNVAIIGLASVFLVSTLVLSGIFLKFGVKRPIIAALITNILFAIIYSLVIANVLSLMGTGTGTGFDSVARLVIGSFTFCILVLSTARRFGYG